MKKQVTILKIDDVLKKTRISRSKLYEMIAKDEFPRQIKIGEKSTAWVEQEIDDWIFERMKERKKERN